MGGVAFNLQPRDLQVEKILAEGKNNPNTFNSMSERKNCLKAVFESGKTFGLFTTHFDEKLYRYDNMQNIVGIAKVLEDVEISRCNPPLYQDAKRFLEQDFWEREEDYDAEIVRKFKNYFTARMLVRLDKEMNEENLQILSFSDDRAKSFKPSWWQNRGICYALDSYLGKLEVVAKTLVDGTLQVRLSGANDQWIDYERLIVNDNVIFDDLHSAHGNSPYVYSIDAKAGEEFKIQVEWQPHRSDT